MMKKQLLILFTLLLTIGVSAQKSGQDVFWDTLSSHCGKSYEGTITSEGKNDGFDGKRYFARHSPNNHPLERPLLPGNNQIRR